jgi:NitT/TauT family transport system ATP-binding protein
MLRLGEVEAAQMLSPVPVAGAPGLGAGQADAIHAVLVRSVDGNTVCLSRDLAARLRAGGHGSGFDDAAAAGRALIAALPPGGAGPRLRIGVPLPFSMHAELMWS